MNASSRCRGEGGYAAFLKHCKRSRIEPRYMCLTRDIPFLFVAGLVLSASSDERSGPRRQADGSGEERGRTRGPSVGGSSWPQTGNDARRPWRRLGAMTVVLANTLPSGQVFATDTGARQLKVIREYVKREGPANVIVIEGAVELVLSSCLPSRRRRRTV